MIEIIERREPKIGFTAHYSVHSYSTAWGFFTSGIGQTFLDQYYTDDTRVYSWHRARGLGDRQILKTSKKEEGPHVKEFD